MFGVLLPHPRGYVTVCADRPVRAKRPSPKVGGRADDNTMGFAKHPPVFAATGRATMAAS